MNTSFSLRTFVAGLALAIQLSFATGAIAAEVSRASATETNAPSPPARLYVDLDADWRFNLGDLAGAMMPAFEDSTWRRLNAPHDWSSEGPFGPEFASCTGFAPGGIGWYRKHFTLDSAVRDQLAAIEFDGVYDHAQVWLNGHFIGGRPYGYSSFECALTPLLKYGAEENVIAVRVDHSRFADSRWYTGSGIYRHVRLRFTDKLRLGHWGVFVTTTAATKDTASLRVETSVENGLGEARSFELRSEVVAPDGRVVANAATSWTLAGRTNQTLVQQIDFPRPQLWSPDSPVLYTLKSSLSAGSKVVDETATPFGIRTFRFDANTGFSLNGTPMKLKGVCLHHDAGCLGAAVPERVWERRLRTLKEIGVNAIRTSHNPPAPELLDLCDRLGFLVKDEAFDEFTPGKNKWMTGWNSKLPGRFGYAELFDQWSVTDARDMVRRDRNHPSIILWSIGNEIDYANDPFSHPVLGGEYRPENPPAQNMVECARPLIAAVKQLDPTRPVTMALANVAMSDAVGLGELLDVVGYNYQESRYASDHAKFPKRVIFGSENSHQFNAWIAVRDHEYISGQFLWTGIDYLGEAGVWPNRANGAGLLDLGGFKKPLAWFRQSLWSDQPMVYLCTSIGNDAGTGRRRAAPQEHWNWPSNRTVAVRCYTTCPEVALTLNGRPLGTRPFADAVQGVLTWEVPFEPGVLKAVGRKGGVALCEFTLSTAGLAHRIALSPEANELRANGRDICQVEFQIVDEHGVRVPDAASEVSFVVDGPAQILGIETGDLSSGSNGKGPARNAYHGRGLMILQSKNAAGKITVRATSPGLDPDEVELHSR